MVCFNLVMGVAADELPDDIATLKAMVIAATARADRLEHLLAVLRRQRFGASSEKLTPDQLALALEDSEAASAEASRMSHRRPRRCVASGAYPTARVRRCRATCRAMKSRSRRR